mgnify:CR=1 FL=1
MNDLSFYKGKRVFVTGHTGFKGTWLCQMLVGAGAQVTGYSLQPPTDPSRAGKPHEQHYWRCARLRLSAGSLP